MSSDPDPEAAENGGSEDRSDRHEPGDPFLAKVVEDAADGVLATDHGGTVVYANPAAGDLFGYSESDLVGRGLEELIPDAADRIRGIVADRAEGSDGGTDAVRVRGRHRDGSDLELAVSPFAVHHDGGVYVAGTLREVGAREARLEERNEQLTRLASVLSHDLREPLNNARAKLTLARETGNDEYIEEVMGVNHRMAELVDEVLDLTTQGMPVEDTELVDLEDAVGDAVSTLDTGDVEVRVVGSPTVRADRERLRTVLENLIGNAVRHAGPDVSVEVGVLPSGDGFYVADDGPGVPPEDREKVFEYGYTTSEAGTGLGLSIVRDVATAHGWSARVTESAEGGARFEFAGVDDVTE